MSAWPKVEISNPEREMIVSHGDRKPLHASVMGQ